jgi:hypothetical protein
VFSVWGRLSAARACHAACQLRRVSLSGLYEVVETFDGSAFIAYRMTIQPSMKAARP